MTFFYEVWYFYNNFISFCWGGNREETKKDKIFFPQAIGMVNSFLQHIVFNSVPFLAVYVLFFCAYIYIFIFLFFFTLVLNTT